MLYDVWWTGNDDVRVVIFDQWDVFLVVEYNMVVVLLTSLATILSC